MFLINQLIFAECLAIQPRNTIGISENAEYVREVNSLIRILRSVRVVQLTVTIVSIMVIQKEWNVTRAENLQY